MRQIDFKSKIEKHTARRMVRHVYLVGCFAGLAVLAAVGLIRTHAQQAFPLPAITPPGAKAAAPATASATPAAQPVAQQIDNTSSEANPPEVAKQCAELLQLATNLKAAVDKSSASTLSVTVVRTAGQIEQLAHKVRNANAKD